MTEIKVKRRVPNKDVVFIDKFPVPKHYTVNFTVIIGKSFTDSHSKFTRSGWRHFESNLTGKEFAIELRAFIIEYVRTRYIKKELQDILKVVSLKDVHYTECPKL